MKKRANLFVITIILMGCIYCSKEIEQPVVEYEVRDEGGTLRLTWETVQGADGYIIYAFGDSIDYTTDTVYDAITPAVFIGPATSIGHDCSYVSYVNSSCRSSSGQSIWNPLDPDSGFRRAIWFTESGQLVPCSVYDPLYDTLYDFYLKVASDVLWLHNRTAIGETNKIALCNSNIFHDVNIASALGAAYQDSIEILEHNIYFIFLDYNSNGYDITVDRFVKLRIDSIIGNEIVLRHAAQEIPGLRWLATIDD